MIRLLKRIFCQRRNHNKGSIQNVKMLEFTFSICHQVVMVKIFKNWSGGKNFGFFEILVFVDRRTYHEMN